MTAELKKLLQQAHVSLILESYDALFSDFDPRPYEQRSISDDFMSEAKKAVKEADSGILEMRFLIPKHQKNAHEEEIIRERLHHYFLQQFHRYQKDAKGIVQRGILLAVTGFLLLFASSYITHQLEATLLLEFLKILMEPSGWFMIWYGFDRIFYEAKSLRPELEFSHKMSKAQIYFDVY